MSQGANTQLGYGFETVRAGQKAATFYGLRVKNFQTLPKPTFERSANIDPRGQQLKGRVLRWDLGWSFDSEMSVDDLVRLRTHHQGYGAITNVATGVNDWALRDLLSSDSLASDISSLSLEADRGDGYAQLLLQAVIREWEIAVRSGKITNTKVSGLACNHTYMKDPAITVSTGTFSGNVNVRNNRQDTDAEATTVDILAKCTTLGALGTCKFKFTKTGTAYSGAEILIPANTWVDVVYGDGTYASGDPLESVQVMFVGTGAFAVDDLVTILAKRPHLTLTYPAKNALTGVAVALTVDGTEYIIENCDLKCTRPYKDRRGTNSKFSLGNIADGRRMWSIKLSRDYYDRAFMLMMMSARAIAFDVTMRGDLIATVSGASYYEKHQLTAAHAQVISGGTDVPNEKQLQESIEVVPFWDGSTVDMTESIRTSIATLV